MGTEPTSEQLQERIRELELEVSATAAVKEAYVNLEEKYKILVDNANDAIFVLQDGKVKFANPKSLEIIGSLANELDNRNFTDFLHPDEKEKVVERYQKRLRGEKVLNMYPLRLINLDGDVIWVEVNAVRIEWESQPATLNIIRDITSQKLCEANFSKADNLTTVRTLAGGLAHELNNLLTGIQGRVSLLSLALGKANALHAHIEQMETLIGEAAKLSKQMVGFAQSGKYHVERVDLNQVAEGAVTALKLSDNAVTIQKEYFPDLWPIEVDSAQIDQVIINVLLNAWQAITGPGVITVRTENVVLQEVRTHIQSLQPGRYVKISIKDTGVGMDDILRKRVFEPFFTTKAIGRHRGLGLASAYGIVVNHRGIIDVGSTPGKGSTFSIWLPAADEKSEGPSAR